MSNATKSYDVTIWDGHCNIGEDTIEASSVAKARRLAEEYARDGSYDHPGTVEVSLVGNGVDERWEVAVGD